MNEWISRINYSSAFKTAGVRMRSLGMSGKDIELAGKAAAASHLRDLQHRGKGLGSPPVRNWDGRKSTEVDGQPSPKEYLSPINVSAPSPLSGRSKSGSVTSRSDSLLTSPIETTSGLLKATFDQVKEDLATGRWRSLDEPNGQRLGRPRAYSLESPLNSPTSPTSSKVDSAIDKRKLPRLSSRSRIIQSKVQDLDSKLRLAQSQLTSDMRFVRNIAVLTPFQRSTRERMQVTVQTAAKRITQVRLDIEKLTCHREVLSRDLLAEERDWQRTKNIALRAATDTLQSQQKQMIPRMTLSMYMEESENHATAEPVPIPRSTTSSTSRRPESSAEGSFHSALDFGSEWSLYLPQDGPGSSSNLLGPSYLQASPTLSSSTTGGSRNSLSESPQRPRAPPLSAESSTTSTSTLDDHPRINGHEKFYTASEMLDEQAEEWNKTRAAKRVSLVKLPPDLKMSMVLGRHGQNGAQGVPDDTLLGRGSITVRPTRSVSALTVRTGNRTKATALDS